MKSMFHRNVFRPYYDDPPVEGSGGEGGNGNGGEGGGTPPPAKTFTQEQLDRIVSERLGRDKKDREKLISELDQLRQSSRLSEEEKEKLTEQIDQLQATLMTKEELAAKEKKELEMKYTKEREKLESEAKTWRERYTNETIDRAIIDAAVSAKAFKPSQIQAILRPTTRLVEELDSEGKATGNLVPKVKFQGRDAEGKPVTLDLTVSEVLKQMKEMPDEYGNLFASDFNGGAGSMHLGAGSGATGFGDLKDTDNYIAQRKKGLKLDNIKA